MRNPSVPSRRLPPSMLLLAACTLWLVVQNTALALIFFWIEPHKAVTLATVLVKTGLVLISGFWTSPAAPLLIGVVLVVGIVAPVVMGRSDREVIHG